MKAFITFPPDRKDPRIWFSIPELENWYPLLIEVTDAVQSFELLPEGHFRATLYEIPHVARYEVTGTYAVYKS